MIGHNYALLVPYAQSTVAGTGALFWGFATFNYRERARVAATRIARG